jgi:hypothetical protein
MAADSHFRAAPPIFSGMLPPAYLSKELTQPLPTKSGSEHRCRVDDQDLSRVVLFNGGGRATASATTELRALEQQARSINVGIWGGRGDDDD